MSRRDRRSGKKRSYTVATIAGLVAVTVVVAFLIYSSAGTTIPGQQINQPVPASVMNSLAGVSPTTLSSIGKGPSGISSPTSISASSNLTLGGKPEVLYMGAEYCPFCAAER